MDTNMPASSSNPVPNRILPHKHTLALAGHRLHFKSAGEGYPLVLIHTPHRYAKSLLNALPADVNYKVITLDIPGFYSKVHGQAITRFGEFIDVLRGFQDAMGYERMDVAGKCLGALVALKYAADNPHRVGRVIAVAPPLALYSTRRGTAMRGLYAVINISKLTRKLARFFNDHPLYLYVTQRLGGYGNYAKMISDEVVRSTEGYDERVLFGVIHSALQINMRRLLSSVLTDTLIVFGEGDPMVGELRAREAIRIMPNARYACIRDAKHAVLERRAEQVNKVVAPFLLSTSGYDLQAGTVSPWLKQS
jgi:4,5:9,10-diseco-3-hydroxy-5,9,17-trioxoandrosta-1(10),2-diene-4-oate hydrolase